MKKANFKQLFNYLSSPKIALSCFSLGMVLLFIGTFYQIKWGAVAAIENIFRAFFIFWQPKWSQIKFPIFPGGYFLAALLLLNLTISIFTSFKFSLKKSGVYFFHLGIIFFILGEFLSGFLSSESTLALQTNQKMDYSLRLRKSEMVIADISGEHEWVFSGADIYAGNILKQPNLPFSLNVKKKINNAIVSSEGDFLEDKNLNIATIGDSSKMLVSEKPVSNKDGDFNYLTIWVEICDAGKNFGTMMLSTAIEEEEIFSFQDKKYKLLLRPKREYFPFQIELTKLEYEYYPGTVIPKSFSSFVNFFSLDGKLDRATLISMNNPINYKGMTFFQQGFNKGDDLSILQVVNNPTWGMSYFASIFVILGLIFHSFNRR